MPSASYATPPLPRAPPLTTGHALEAADTASPLPPRTVRQAAAGSSIQNRAPLPGSLSHPTFPPIVVKTGVGTLVLGGPQQFTGATVVSAGTLRINGSSMSATTIQNGATLGGSGSFGGLTTIQSGAHLAPGNSVGTLTFNSGLTLNTGSILNFELGTTSDLISVTSGILTGPSGIGGVTLHLSNSGGFAAGTYTLFDFNTGGTTTSDFEASDFALGSTISGFTYSLALNGNTLQLTASAIPEPSTYAAIFGALVLGLAAYRRHTRSRSS